MIWIKALPFATFVGRGLLTITKQNWLPALLSYPKRTDPKTLYIINKRKIKKLVPLIVKSFLWFSYIEIMEKRLLPLNSNAKYYFGANDGVENDGGVWWEWDHNLFWTGYGKKVKPIIMHHFEADGFIQCKLNNLSF